MSTLLQSNYSEFEYSTNASITQIPMWFWVIYGFLVVLMIASLWRVYTKCGEPGWACIIPIFNIYVMCRMVKKPEYFKYLLGGFAGYILGFIIMASGPAFLGGIVVAISAIALLVFSIMLYNELSKAFGQGTGFTIGLIFLSFIFIPLLAWGNYHYVLNNDSSKSGDLLDA